MGNEMTTYPMKGGPAVLIVLDEENSALKVPTTTKKYIIDSPADGSGFALPAGASATDSKPTYQTQETSHGVSWQLEVSKALFEVKTGELATTDSSGNKVVPKLTLVMANPPLLGTARINYDAHVKFIDEIGDKPVLAAFALGEDLTGSFDNCGYVFLIGKRSNEVKVGGANYGKFFTDSIEISAVTLTIPDEVKAFLTAADLLPKVTAIKYNKEVTFPPITAAGVERFKLGKHFNP